MEDNEIFLEIFVGLICLSISIYSLFVAISFFYGKNLKNTNIYKIGEVFSRKVQSKERIEKIVSDLETPEKLKKYGILFFFFSIVSLILTIVVLFG